MEGLLVWKGGPGDASLEEAISEETWKQVSEPSGWLSGEGKVKQMVSQVKALGRGGGGLADEFETSVSGEG